MFNILKLNMYLSMKASLSILSIPDHPYQTRNRQEINPLFVCVENIRMSCKYQFVKVWNELSPELKCVNSPCNLSRRLLFKVSSTVT